MLEIKVDGIGSLPNLQNSTGYEERDKINKILPTSNNTASEYPLDLTLQKR